ncbi:MAG TPA: hypothetical protein PKB00_16635, partial [Microthrixaceae bacterium]|nr:hypothetical protein [Microthrixaceae bacterium]
MSNRTRTVSAVVVVAVLALIGGGLYWFLRDDAPDEVDLDTAAEGVSTTGSTPGGSSSTAPG